MASRLFKGLRSVSGQNSAATDADYENTSTPATRVDMDTASVEVEWKYDMETQIGYRLFGKTSHENLQKFLALAPFGHIILLNLLVVIAIANCVLNIPLLNLIFIPFYFHLYATSISTLNIVRAKESLLQFQAILNLILATLVFINTVITAEAKAVPLCFLSLLIGHVVEACRSGAHPKLLRKSKYLFLGTMICHVVMFALIIIDAIKIKDIRLELKIRGKQISWSSLQLLLSNLVSMCALMLKTTMYDWCLVSYYINNIKYKVLYVLPKTVSDEPGSNLLDSTSELMVNPNGTLSRKVIKKGMSVATRQQEVEPNPVHAEVDVRHGSVTMEYGFPKTNQLGYKLFGKYHLYHVECLKYKKIGLIFYFVSALICIPLVVGNTVWNVPAVNICYLFLFYDIYISAAGFDVALFRRCLYELESMVNILFGLMVALNAAVTSPWHVSSLFWLLCLREIELAGQSSLNSKLRVANAPSYITSGLCYFIMVFLIFFGKAPVEDIRRNIVIGARELELSSLQSLISQMSILIILSIKKTYSALCTKGDSNIKFRVSFVKPGTLTGNQGISDPTPNISDVALSASFSRPSSQGSSTSAGGKTDQEYDEV